MLVVVRYTLAVQRPEGAPPFASREIMQERALRTDAKGRFRIERVPVGRPFHVHALAKRAI